MHPGPAWFDTAEILIGGRWGPGASGSALDLVDPSTGAPLARIARGSADDIDRAVLAARAACEGAWGSATAAERGRLLARLGQLVERHADDLATLEARDVGKPLRQARADVAALARYMEFYAGAADKLMGTTIPYLRGYTVFTEREPHGVTGHIIPWNYPMQILGRSLGGALAAGNAAVVKPAEDACLTALALGRLAEEAGFPDGAVNIVTGTGDEAGAALAGHRGVDHISFTGSVAVGAMVQTAAARNVVPVTLELGGKSPHVVFADADLDAALPYIVNSGIQNAGQTCSAGSRILVQRAAFEPLLERLTERYEALQAGPALTDPDVGPIVSRRQMQRVTDMIASAPAGSVVARGKIAPDAPEGGFYVPPALLAGLAPSHPLCQDEVFGPVQVILPFADEDEAVALANGTPYGLVAAVWTGDGSRALRVAKRLRAGQVFVNNYGAGGGVELPFGGVGKSGHGREKGFEALLGFTRVKTTAILHG